MFQFMPKLWNMYLCWCSQQNIGPRYIYTVVKLLGGQDTDCQRERKLPSFRIPGCKYTKPVAHTDKFKYFSIWQHYSKSPIADHLTKHNCADLFLLVNNLRLISLFCSRPERYLLLLGHCCCHELKFLIVWNVNMWIIWNSHSQRFTGWAVISTMTCLVSFFFFFL